MRTFHIASDHEQESSQLISSKHSSSPFPFHRLPYELLAAVFEEGVRSSLPRFSEHSIPFPIIVSHVCRLWRDTALDCATLWTDVFIDDNRMADTYQIFRLYLARSKSILIDVRCHWHTFTCDDPPFKATITDILSHIGRVRHLSMVQQSETVFLPVMDILRDVAAPRLESLLIFLPYQNHPDEDHPQADSLPLFTRGAPLLRSIIFTEVPYIVQPQFTRLTSFSLRIQTHHNKITLREFLDFLSNISQTLINLRVWGVCLQISLTEPNLSPVELPQLQHLCLHKADIFSHLHTPRLQSLFLHGRRYLPDTMENFTKRCSSFELSKLQFLRFDKLDLSLFKGQTAVVHGLPLLTELVFWGCEEERAFLSLLKENYSMPDQRKGEILPRLRSLTVSHDHCWLWLQEILANRIAGGIPIKFVRFPERVRDSERMKNWLTARSIDWELCDLDGEPIYDRHDFQWDEGFFLTYDI